MPETVDTAKEIVKIRHEIQDIKQSQEADMQFNKEKYLQLVSDVLRGSPLRTKVFLEVNGVKSRKEVQVAVGGYQANVWHAMDILESKGLIVRLEETKSGSPIYTKPRWVRALRIDDYVRTEILPQPAEQAQVQSPPGSSDSQPNA